MAPSIQDDYIIAVDASQAERPTLYGKIVIAWHKDEGLIVSRLQRFGGLEPLMPDSRDYTPVSLARIAAGDQAKVGRGPDNVVKRGLSFVRKITPAKKETSVLVSEPA